MRRQGSPVHSPVELGRIVRARREELAFTLAHVAGLTGIDPTIIDSLERGESMIELRTAVLVLQLLGLEILVGEIYSHKPKDREYEMFRLRVVEGLTLSEIAELFGLHRERIRQLLRTHFRLRVPPAASARRSTRAKAARRRRTD
jgi:transcriptional regulator with XRE-family HTH domain